MKKVIHYSLLAVRVSCITVYFLFPGTHVFAQRDSLATQLNELLSFKGYFSSLGDNFAKQASSPFHLHPRGCIETAVIISSTLILTTIDGNADDEVKNLKTENSFINDVNPVVTELGGTYGIAGACTFGLAGIIFKNNKVAETGLLATQAIITSGLWVTAGKYLSGRERPLRSYESSGLPGGKWYGLFTEISNPSNLPSSSFNSFPSGHTSTAFAIATVFAMQYKNCKAVPLTVYTIAAVVGASRMIEQKHWLSDVFAGAALGHLCARQIMNSYFVSKGKSADRNRAHIFIVPDFSFAPSAKAVVIF